ncbi:MAG TPA: hypothetical protein VNY06_07700 [Methylocella sp.]|jgi:hypothetical protein|nr:hypothetical protein [Methylocella sp.]
MLHDELLKRGHDLFAVVDRQTNFARCKPLKSFIDLQLRPLDFAKFVRHPRVFAALVESNETS